MGCCASSSADGDGTLTGGYGRAVVPLGASDKSDARIVVGDGSGVATVPHASAASTRLRPDDAPINDSATFADASPARSGSIGSAQRARVVAGANGSATRERGTPRSLARVARDVPKLSLGGSPRLSSAPDLGSPVHSESGRTPPRPARAPRDRDRDRDTRRRRRRDSDGSVHSTASRSSARTRGSRRQSNRSDDGDGKLDGAGGGGGGAGGEVFATIGPYTVYTKVLGKGMSSEVRGCRRRDTKKRYAMKIVRKQKALVLRRGNSTAGTPTSNPWGVSGALATEIDVLTQVKHPNIVKLVDILEGETGSDLNMVFELLTPLKKRLFGEAEAKVIFRQVVGAIAYLHKRHIIHRDVKPSNLLLGRELSKRQKHDSRARGRRRHDASVVKLSDFGSCCRLRGEHDVVHTTEGTAANFPPEMCPPSCGWDPFSSKRERGLFDPGGGEDGGDGPDGADDGIDPEARGLPSKQLWDSVETTPSMMMPFAGTPSDIWALGVTVHQMCVGRHPFLATTREKTFEAIVKRRLKFEGPREEALSEELKDFLRDSGSPEHRPIARHAVSAGVTIVHSPVHRGPTAALDGSTHAASAPGVASAGSGLALELPLSADEHSYSEIDDRSDIDDDASDAGGGSGLDDADSDTRSDVSDADVGVDGSASVAGDARGGGGEDAPLDRHAPGW